MFKFSVSVQMLIDLQTIDFFLVLSQGVFAFNGCQTLAQKVLSYCFKAGVHKCRE